MEQAKALWGEGVEPTPANLHAAAVGLAAQWYRNTETVEHHVHATGPWGDPDMLRNNARVTALCLNALSAIADVPHGVLDVLQRLLHDICHLLPTPESRQALLSEKAGAPGVLNQWIEINGLGNALSFLTAPILYPSAWWGAAGYEQIIERYCTLDVPPPDAATFRARMLKAPWELSDEQAAFVCDRRYDVRGGS